MYPRHSIDESKPCRLSLVRLVVASSSAIDPLIQFKPELAEAL